MNYCLRCNGFCEGSAVFCNGCQSALLNRSQWKEGDFRDPVLFASLPVQVIEQGQTDPQSQIPGLMTPVFPDAPDEPPEPFNEESETVIALPTTTSLQIARDRQRQHMVRMRRIFIWLSIIAIIALVADGVLITLVTVRQIAHNQQMRIVAPTLTLSQANVLRGQIIGLHLSHCQPQARIFLSHDVQEALQVDASSPLIQVNVAGEADVHIRIDGSWKLGTHRIQAEDIRTHYVFSTTLRVVGAGPIQPPHLQVSQATLDMGIALQGKNSIQSLLLSNTGGGTIAWIASSDQPWLQLTPTQGIFSDSQAIAIAVSRANLLPGNYQGTITIVSNTGIPSSVQVSMAVLPLPTDAGAVLAVTPPALAFSAIDGATETVDQVLQISNPGSRPLSWSIDSRTPIVAASQSGPAQNNTHWLSVQPTSGVVVPHGIMAVHVFIHGQTLLAGTYGGSLIVSAGQNTLNDRQPVAISLNVQQRCGVETSADNLTFSVLTGQHQPAFQLLGLNATAGCNGAIPWQAFPLADWLSITPVSGQVQAGASVAATVSVNEGQLKPGLYRGFIMFLTEQHIKTVEVKLSVLAPPAPAYPRATATTGTSGGGTVSTNNNNPPSISNNGTQINTTNPPPATLVVPATSITPDPPALSISSSNLAFTATQGALSPPAQVVALADTGGSSFSWQAVINTSNASWLSIAPVSDVASPGLPGQLTVMVSSDGLTSGTYKAQISVTAIDTAGMSVPGSPQTITVALTVLPPCSVQVSPTSLSFSTSLLQSSSPAQSLSIKSTGGCARPISWTAQVDHSSQNWLILSASSGLDNGTGSIITVSVNARNVLLGARGQITISAVDANGIAIPNSTQTVVVTLSLL